MKNLVMVVASILGIFFIGVVVGNFTAKKPKSDAVVVVDTNSDTLIIYGLSPTGGAELGTFALPDGDITIKFVRGKK